MTTVAQLTRRRRPVRESGWQRTYYWLIAVGFAAAIGVPQLVRFTSWLFSGAGLADPARGLALLLALLAGLLMLLAWVGPVVASPADMRWLILSPLNRRRVLARNALVLLASLTVAGLALSSLGTAVFGRPQDVIACVSLGVSVAIAAGSAAVLLQAAEARYDWLRLTVILLAVVVGLLILLRPALPGLPIALIAYSAPVVAAFLAWHAWQALSSFPSRALLNTSIRMGTLVAASFNLEPAVLTSIAEQRFWRSKRLRSRAWPVTGRLAMVRSDARMLSRRPGRLAVLAALISLPVLVRFAGGTTGLAMIVLFCGGLAAATTAAAGARWDVQHPELARLFTMKWSAARAVMPAVFAFLWVSLAFVLLSIAGFMPIWSCLYGLAMAPGLAAGALRMAQRGAINHAMPVIDLGSGGIPTGPVLWAITGIDLAALGSTPLLLAVTPTSLAIQALLSIVLLGVYLRHQRRS
ncbi:DUF6297 family protein [Streptosporangium sp. NBC_01755]|uniref:DUF6297 family protein n=1 Tax=Streptosporangium sp. NBC_01755 TaxID=2975949 RepID=UPI002DD7FA9E|nr:DUF6297 family protein [Streptosporangium sp. NBC_01755]WSD00607.1 DUF6297 family protein [Streptosporangium sp. NBC_01755]